jgi:hypothetical protein
VENQELELNPDTLRRSRCVVTPPIGRAAMKNISRRETGLEDAIDSAKQSVERLKSEKAACCEAIRVKLNADASHLNTEEDFLLGMFHDKEDSRTFKEAMQSLKRDKWWKSYQPEMK